jgi:hypothetical protein
VYEFQRGRLGRLFSCYKEHAATQTGHYRMVSLVPVCQDYHDNSLHNLKVVRLLSMHGAV